MIYVLKMIRFSSFYHDAGTQVFFFNNHRASTKYLNDYYLITKVSIGCAKMVFDVDVFIPSASNMTTDVRDIIWECFEAKT